MQAVTIKTKSELLGLCAPGKVRKIGNTTYHLSEDGAKLYRYDSRHDSVVVSTISECQKGLLLWNKRATVDEANYVKAVILRAEQQNAAEIQAMAITLRGLRESGNSIFSIIPLEIVNRVASHVGNPDIHSPDEARRIANK